MLAQTVEALPGVRSEGLQHAVCLLATGAVRSETAFVLSIQNAPLSISEDYMTIPQVDFQTQGGSCEPEQAVSLPFPAPVSEWLLRKHTEGFATGEVLPRRHRAYVNQRRGSEVHGRLRAVFSADGDSVAMIADGRTGRY